MFSSFLPLVFIYEPTNNNCFNRGENIEILLYELLGSPRKVQILRVKSPNLKKNKKSYENKHLILKEKKKKKNYLEF